MRTPPFQVLYVRHPTTCGVSFNVITGKCQLPEMRRKQTETKNRRKKKEKKNLQVYARNTSIPPMIIFPTKIVKKVLDLLYSLLLI